MRARSRAHALAAGLACAAHTLAASSRQESSGLAPSLVLAPDLEVAEARVVDLEGRAGSELLLVGRAGEVLVLALAADRAGFEPVEDSGSQRLVLASPERSLLALERIDGESALVVLSPEGALRHAWRAGAGFDPQGQVLAARARFDLRVGQPQFSPFLSDVDGDGLADVSVPDVGSCTLWRRTLGEESPPLVRMASLPHPVARGASSEAGELTDELRASFSIPALRTRDVNGDGRADLLVSSGKRRAFHLQRADGSFASQPDVELDLTLFRDTTPRPALAPGEILPGDDEQGYRSEDLDGDGIPDSVISHRRKVWIFLGTREGPRFDQGARVLKVSEDVTALLIEDVDRDERPDLVLIKVRVPSVSRLILGLVSEWEIGAHVLGFRNQGGGSFGSAPAWDRELSLGLPPVLELLRSSEKIVQRVEEIGHGFEATVTGDFSGDGSTDLVLLASEPRRLRLWRSQPGDGGRLGTHDEPDHLRELLFESERTRWKLDDVFDWIAGMASARVEQLTAGRAADEEIAVRPAQDWLLLGALACDLDGDGRQELLVGYEERSRPGRLSFDWVRP